MRKLKEIKLFSQKKNKTYTQRNIIINIFINNKKTNNFKFRIPVFNKSNKINKF